MVALVNRCFNGLIDPTLINQQPECLSFCMRGRAIPSTDISSDEVLAKLPDPIDVALFEEHLPNTSGIHRINALKYVWLPTRVYLLRALFYTCGAEPDVAKLTECVSAFWRHATVVTAQLRTDLRLGAFISDA